MVKKKKAFDLHELKSHQYTIFTKIYWWWATKPAPQDLIDYTSTRPNTAKGLNWAEKIWQALDSFTTLKVEGMSGVCCLLNRPVEVHFLTNGAIASLISSQCTSPQRNSLIEFKALSGQKTFAPRSNLLNLSKLMLNYFFLQKCPFWRIPLTYSSEGFWL